jgi:hypothetical protein
LFFFKASQSARKVAPIIHHGGATLLSRESSREKDREGRWEYRKIKTNHTLFFFLSF